MPVRLGFLLIMCTVSCVHRGPDTAWQPRISEPSAADSTYVEQEGPVDDEILVGFMSWGSIEYWDLNNDDHVDLEIRSGNPRSYRIDDDYDGYYDRDVMILERFTDGYVYEEKIRTPVNGLRKLNRVYLRPMSSEFSHHNQAWVLTR